MVTLFVVLSTIMIFQIISFYKENNRLNREVEAILLKYDIPTIEVIMRRGLKIEDYAVCFLHMY